MAVFDLPEAGPGAEDPRRRQTAPLSELEHETPPADSRDEQMPSEAEEAPVTTSGEVSLEPDETPGQDAASWWEVGSAGAGGEADAQEGGEEPAVEQDLGGTRMLSAERVPELSRRGSTQGLAFGARRDIGRVRKANQDSIYALLTTLPREGNDVFAGLFVVADGMGGHEGGEIASRLAIRTVAHEILANLIMPSFDDTVAEALQALMITAVEEANRVIWDYARQIGSDMGTTCSAALLLNHMLFMAHVGDSRIYMVDHGRLEQLTTDHSTVERLIGLGQLDPSEAREHPLRNQLYRTVGQMPEVEVDFSYQAIGGASHLLLCSDGLWGMLDAELIRRTLAGYPLPQDACNELIALANLAGGEDNISAIVVTLPVGER